MKMLMIFFIALSLISTSCKKGALVDTKMLSTNLNQGNGNGKGPKNPPITPTDPGQNSGNGNGSNPTYDPKAGQGCTGKVTDFCLGGYDGDKNAKSIPVKIYFLNKVGQSFSSDPKTDGKKLIDDANKMLNYQGHQFIKFAAPEVVNNSISDLCDFVEGLSCYVEGNDIKKYGSKDHYTIVLVKDLLATYESLGGGTIGYSPGLRIDWESGQAIVVMDYDYVKSDKKGNIVVVHELFHGLGAPHTTVANGQYADFFADGGLLNFRTLSLNKKYGGGSALINKDLVYDFSIYLDPSANFQGTKSAGGLTWDTRTVMFYAAVSVSPLFVDGNNGIGFNNAYSHVLHNYYEKFVK